MLLVRHFEVTAVVGIGVLRKSLMRRTSRAPVLAERASVGVLGVLTMRQTMVSARLAMQVAALAEGLEVLMSPQEVLMSLPMREMVTVLPSQVAMALAALHVVVYGPM